ncbi:MAG: hypothetical protein ACTJHU_02545 [Mycetocola sp.]
MTDPHSAPSAQEHYQVRAAAGDDANAALASADLLIWVDALGQNPCPLRSIDRPADRVRTATLPTVRDIAGWVCDVQEHRGERVSVAIVWAGGARNVPDELVAGSVVDALGQRGIDATSPEAAMLGAAAATLQRAILPLIRASVPGREFASRAGAAELDRRLGCAVE